MSKKQERIQRLALAITYYREMKPREPGQWHKHLLASARRFNVAPKLIQIALEMEREGISQ